MPSGRYRVTENQLRPNILDKEVRRLCGPDPQGFLTKLGLTWASIALAVLCAQAAQNIWIHLLVILFIGTRQSILALLVHDQTHRLGLNSRLGDVVCQLLAAYPLMITLEEYRRVHLTHHRYPFTDKDPDYLRKRGKEWEFPQPLHHFLGTLLTDLLGLNVVKTLKGKRLSLKDALIKSPSPVSVWVRPLYYITSACILTATGTWLLFLLYWILPLLSVMQVIIRLMAVMEHTYNLENPTLIEATPLIKPTWWESWILPDLNFHFHLYHHWYPAISFGRLPMIHEKFKNAGLVRDENFFHGYFEYFLYLFDESRGRPKALDGSKTLS